MLNLEKKKRVSISITDTTHNDGLEAYYEVAQEISKRTGHALGQTEVCVIALKYLRDGLKRHVDFCGPITPPDDHLVRVAMALELYDNACKSGVVFVGED